MEIMYERKISIVEYAENKMLNKKNRIINISVNILSYFSSHQ